MNPRVLGLLCLSGNVPTNVLDRLSAIANVSKKVGIGLVFGRAAVVVILIVAMVLAPFPGKNRGRSRKAETLSTPSTTWVIYPKPASNLLLLSADLGRPSTCGFGFPTERREVSTRGGGLARGKFSLALSSQITLGRFKAGA